MTNILIHILAYVLLFLMFLLSMFLSACTTVYLDNIFEFNKHAQAIIYIVSSIIFYIGINVNLVEFLKFYGRKKFKNEFKEFELTELEKKYE